MAVHIGGSASKPSLRDAGGSHTPGHAATKKKKRKAKKVVSARGPSY